MATITATPLPALGQVLVTVEDQDGSCVQVERVIDATGARAPLRPYVWVCSDRGEFLHLSDAKAYFWDTEAPLDVSFHYEATAVDAAGTPIGKKTIFGGLLLPGFSPGGATTPDNAALDITGDLDLRADATLDDWTPPVEGGLVSKWSGGAGTNSYILSLTNSGTLRLYTSNDGTAVLSSDSTIAIPISAGRLAVRATIDVDNGAGGRTITFYTAPNIGGPWTQLGAVVTVGATTSIFSSTSIVEVGGWDNGTSARLVGLVHAVEIYNGIAGTLVANPRFWAQANGATAFTDASGRAWTVNAPGAITASTPATVTGSTPLVLASNGGFWLRDPVRPCNDQRMELCFDDPECGANGGIFVADMAVENNQANSVLQQPTNARRPIPIARQRRDTDSQLTVVTASFADRDAVLALNEPGSPLLFSAPPEYGVPDRYMSVAVESTSRGVQDDRFPARMIQMPFVTVDRPVGPTQGTCGHRIDDICTTYATWGAAEAAAIDWGRLITGDPASLGLRTWGQVKSTWASWTAVKAANTDWADVRSL